jgi:hypothetical protein
MVSMLVLLDLVVKLWKDMWEGLYHEFGITYEMGNLAKELIMLKA